MLSTFKSKVSMYESSIIEPSPTSVTNICRQHQCNNQRLKILVKNSPRVSSAGVCVGDLSVREKAKSYCTNMSINMRWQALEMS